MWPPHCRSPAAGWGEAGFFLNMIFFTSGQNPAKATQRGTAFPGSFSLSIKNSQDAAAAGTVSVKYLSRNTQTSDEDVRESDCCFCRLIPILPMNHRTYEAKNKPNHSYEQRHRFSFVVR